MVQNNPSLKIQQKLKDENFANYEAPRFKNAKIIIPVVFHVIHTYGSENVSKADIEAQLETMNKNFNQENTTELAKVNPAFKDVIGNIGIEFRLARKDPNGNCTEGINRIYSTQTVEAHDNVKGLSRWDPSKYMNIWVVKTINSSSTPGSTILGYAYFPGISSAVDGIVIRADQIRAGNKTLTHEAGHYFFLYHTFEGGCGNSNCNSSGDGICDTPPTAEANFGCAKNLNSCSSDKPDLPDMVENFMDYGDCTYMFTKGQNSKIQYILGTSVNRVSLYTQSNLIATGVADGITPSTCAPVADFQPEKFIVCANKPVKFIDYSFNGPVTKYEWTFGGGVPSSTDKNPSISFPVAGTYDVTLKVTNGSGNSVKTRKAIITVLPGESDVKTPFVENFESFDKTGWEMPANNGDGLKWKLSSSVGATSSSKSIYLQNSIATADVEYFLSLPPVDLTTENNYDLTFDLAYAQKNATTSKDVLRLSLSTDCGLNYTYIYQNVGPNLKTTAAPVSGTFIPAQNEWREEKISLSSYKTEKNLYIRLSLFNRGGNDIYIDNIRIGKKSDSGSAIEDFEAGGFELYPNPTSGQLSIRTASPDKIKNIEIFDLSGKLLYHQPNLVSNTLTLDLKAINIYSGGMYYVKINTKERSFVQKFVVSQP